MKKIYLCHPYGHENPDIMEVRARSADRLAARLMEQGYVVFSPISHSHRISRYTNVDPRDHAFWLKQDMPYIPWCDIMAVPDISASHLSTGINKYELPLAARLGRERVLVDPITAEIVRGI